MIQLNRTMKVILIVVMFWISLSIQGKLLSITPIECTDNSGISETGSCNDGEVFMDSCRIDGQPILLETSCSSNKCVIENIDCSVSGGVCQDGKCIQG